MPIKKAFAYLKMGYNSVEGGYREEIKFWYYLVNEHHFVVVESEP